MESILNLEKGELMKRNLVIACQFTIHLLKLIKKDENIENKY